jgi:hypothetical protein
MLRSIRRQGENSFVFRNQLGERAGQTSAGANGGGEEELVDKESGETGGIVANHSVFFEQVVISNHAHAELQKFVAIEAHLFGILSAITAGHFRRDGPGIGDDNVNHTAAHMLLNGAEVIAEQVMRGFTRLGHQVCNVDPRRFRVRDGAHNFRDEQIRNDAGIERAGTHEDQVSLFDGFDSRRERTDAPRIEFEFADGNLAARDAGFSVNALAIAERCHQMHVGNRGRKDAAAHGENFRGDANRFGEVASNVRKRGEKKIAEIVSGEAAAGVETVLKEAREKGFVLGERHHAVANIAGRKHAVLAAKPAGAAAVIGHGDDRGEIGDRAPSGRKLIAAAYDVFLQAAEKGRKPRAAAESDNTQARHGNFGTRISHERALISLATQGGERLSLSCVEEASRRRMARPVGCTSKSQGR